MLDVGTTGVKALVFDASLRVVARAYRKLGKRRPGPGRVEQDPRELAAAGEAVLRRAVRDAGVRPSSIAGLGITNQRETTIVWDRKTGRPIAPAIVWEDSRTAASCARLRRSAGALVRRRTGLAVSPYFSASKIAWILARVPGARGQAERGELAFGTVDSWMLWNLCEGRPHLTDATNAQRTMLYALPSLGWDARLLDLFGVPASMLPRVLPSRARYGRLAKRVLGAPIPVVAVCGDQQSSMYAAERFPGARRPVTKVTFGTGVFVAQEARDRAARRDGFFTMLVPGARVGKAALEQKIDGSGEAVTARLGDRAALLRYFGRLSRRVARLLRRLPARPLEIIVDGGAVRDGLLPPVLARVAGVPVRTQRTYDGTALGTALLVLGR